MGRLIPLMLAAALSGCAALTTVAAIPGALVDGVVGIFQGQKRSLPVDMRTALVATQLGLRSIRLDVDVLEPVKGGYDITFGNDKLDGSLQLTPMTSMLTTMDIKVRHGISRERSVEKALLDEIQDAATHVPRQQSFDFSGYDEIFALPKKDTKRLGWFRRKAKLHLHASYRHGWLSIGMPSGANGFVEGGQQAGTGKH